MTGSRPTDRPQISLFAIGATLLRRRWWIVAGGVGGAAIAATVAQLRPVTYASTAWFVPQGASDAPLSGLAGIAGQFGVSLPSGTQMNTPEFYVALVRTREVLGPLANDTLVVREQGDRRVAIPDLLGVGPSAAREEVTVRMLNGLFVTSITRPVGIVELTVRTKWASVSAAIDSALLVRINDVSNQMRQQQAANDRRFYESQMDLALRQLRFAEDSLKEFMRGNVQIGRSPDLRFREQQLERAVSFRQQVYEQMAVSYETGRIKEVRDGPGITLVERPRITAEREPRRRVFFALIGGILGGLVAILAVFVAELTAHRRRDGDPHVDEFLSALGELKVGRSARTPTATKP